MSNFDDIESRLNSIEKKIDELPYSLLWFVLCVFIGWAFSSIDFSFSIPAHKPVKLKMQDSQYVNSAKDYSIIYNENFTGVASYLPSNNSVDFHILNKGKEVVDFKDARIYIWTKDDKKYEVRINNFSNKDYGGFGEALPMLNPGSVIDLYTTVPFSVPEVEKIKGFMLLTKDKIKIRFGYKPFLWLNEIRWALADIVRKD